jgi:signal transduction histidine kinase
MADINEVIAKSVGILENEFRLEHIEVKQDLLNDMPEILIDTNQLEQVFVNLLINAVEAIGDSGAITIRSCLGPDGNSVRAVITDTGCGIDREQMGKIFEPFFSTKSKGTGLGLAVSYGIVRNHQGDIRVTSRPGKGTSFTVMLPMLQKDDAAQAGGH